MSNDADRLREAENIAAESEPWGPITRGMPVREGLTRDPAYFFEDRGGAVGHEVVELPEDDQQ